MKIDKSKSNRQKKGADKWRYSSLHGADRNGRGTFIYPGGFGKTYTALNFIIVPYIDYSTKHREVTILVPRESLLKQWNQKIVQILDKQYHKHIKVITIQHCISNNLVIDTDLLIVDELHLFYDDVWIKYINGIKIKYKHNLGLTATYNDPNNRHLQIAEIYPVIDKITQQEALNNNWISKFIEYNLCLDLPLDDIPRYQQLTTVIQKNLQKFGNSGFKGAIKIVSGGYQITYDEFGNQIKTYYKGIQYANMWARKMGWHPDCSDDINNIWNPNKIIGYAKLILNAVRERKEMLYDHPLKLQKAAEICDKFKDYKTISFSQSTNYADLFAATLRKKEIPCVVYHSNLESRPIIDSKTKDYIRYKSGKRKGEPKMFGKKTLRKFAIEQIKSGKTKHISTASSLDVGFDVEDMMIGIIASRSSNFNNQNQRKFRITRIDPFNPETTCLLINLVFMDTKDEQWLATAQKENENEVHWINSINEIDFKPNLDEYDL